MRLNILDKFDELLKVVFLNLSCPNMVSTKFACLQKSVIFTNRSFPFSVGLLWFLCFNKLSLISRVDLSLTICQELDFSLSQVWFILVRSTARLFHALHTRLRSFTANSVQIYQADMLDDK